MDYMDKVTMLLALVLLAMIDPLYAVVYVVILIVGNFIIGEVIG